jgi:hypothetical protein
MSYPKDLLIDLKKKYIYIYIRKIIYYFYLIFGFLIFTIKFLSYP